MNQADKTFLDEVLDEYMSREQRSNDWLAEATGLSKATIRNWREGKVKRPRNWQDVAKIAIALHLKLAETDRLLQAAHHDPIVRLQTQFTSAEDITLFSHWTRELDQHSLIPNLPDYFQTRDDDLARLKALVLDQDGRSVGIQGMGGIGKTLLAAALTHDPDIRDAFPDGIYWLTLGYEPQLLNRQVELARLLEDNNPVVADINDATTHLRKLLQGKKCLLVLDDLWHTTDAGPLDVIDTRSGSRLLVTTRDSSVLTGLRAHELQLDILNEAQSLALIVQVIGLDSVDDLPQEAKEVAKRCKYLPLALAVSAANIADGYLWRDLLTALDKARLDYLDHEQGSIMATFQISIDRLSEAEANLYHTFAIFPEDMPLPEEMLVTFWTHHQRIEPFEVHGIIARLERRALLTISGKPGKRSVILHDLLRLFVRQNTENLRYLHQQWLEAYEKQCNQTINGVVWASGPDDGYFYQNIAYHLVHTEHITDTLTIVEPDFRTAKSKLFGSDFSFVQDLKLIIEAIEANQSSILIPAIVRCSLVQALITSITHKVHPEVLTTLIGFGAVERAKELADLSPEGQEKVEQLLAVARSLKEIGGHEHLFRETLQKALTSTRLLTRSQVVEGQPDAFRTEIAVLLADLDWDWSEQILAEITHEYHLVRSRIYMARTIAPDHERALKLLTDILPNLTVGQIYFSELAETLGYIGKFHLEAVQDFIDLFPDQHSRDWIRQSVIQTLLEIEAPGSLEVARKIRNPTMQAQSISSIAGQWAKQNEPAEAFNLLSEIAFTQENEHPLNTFVYSLSPEQAEYGLRLAEQVTDTQIKPQLLARTALLYAKRQNLSKVQEILTDIYQLAGHVQPTEPSYLFLSIELGEIVTEVALFDPDSAEEIINDSETIEFGADLAGQVSAKLLNKDLDLALRFAEMISRSDWLLLVLADACFRLPSDDPRVPELRKQVVELADKLRASRQETNQLRAYYLGIEGKATPENILAIWSLEIDDLRHLQYKQMGGIRVSESNVPSDDDVKEREEILIDMALRVAATDIDRAFVLLSFLTSHRQVDGLTRLARLFIPDNTLETAQNYHYVTKSVERICTNVSLLAKYDTQLAEGIIEAIPGNDTRAIAYASVARALRNESLQHASQFLERALRISEVTLVSYWKPIAYLELDKYSLDECPADCLEKAYQAIEKIPAGNTAVAGLIQHYVSHLVNKGDLEEALRIAVDMLAYHLIFQAPQKVRALLDICEAASESQNSEITQEAWNLAFEIIQQGSDVHSTPRLASLAISQDPTLADRLFTVAVEAAISSIYRDQILRNVVHYRAPSDSESALDAARKIRNQHNQAFALASIVSRGNLADVASRQMATEAIELLKVEQENVDTKAMTLLKLIEANAFEEPTATQLIRDLVDTASHMYPIERRRAIGFLVQAHNHFVKAGNVAEAKQTLTIARELALSAPREKSQCLVQVAEPLLTHSHNEAVSVIYHALQLARMEDYDEVWATVSMMIPALHGLGEDQLLGQLCKELEAAESFLNG